MHDAGDRRMAVIADRIGILAWLGDQFRGARNELTRDRIVGIAGVDQRGHVRRHRHRIAFRDLFQIGQSNRRRKAAGEQLGGLAQSPDQLDLAHASPAGGVHTA
jgi:hypothetical protein